MTEQERYFKPPGADHQSVTEESPLLSGSYLDRFAGVGRSYGLFALDALVGAHACVVGIGGVGSWSAESLVRSGVGRITLIDLDEICVTNTNRQIHALTSTIGQPKVEAMAKRLMDINPELVVHSQQLFYTEKSEELLLGPLSSSADDLPRFDVLIDAIDQTQRKAQLIIACTQRRIPIITCGAAGGRRAPHKVMTADLRDSTHDGLLRRVKKLLKKTDRFIQGVELEGGEWGIPAIFSKENPYYPTACGGVSRTPPTREALRLDCNVGFGSLSFVTATFGLTAASLAIDIILQGDHR